MDLKQETVCIEAHSYVYILPAIANKKTSNVCRLTSISCSKEMQ